jgi:hypothetical protein
MYQHRAVKMAVFAMPFVVGKIIGFLWQIYPMQIIVSTFFHQLLAKSKPADKTPYLIATAK